MGMRQPYSWMMKSVWDHPVCSLWVHSGVPWLGTLESLQSKIRFTERSWGTWCFFLVDPNLISMVTIPR